MNALTAQPSPITTTTLPTVTAAGVASPTQICIDAFIKAKLKEAKSDAFSGLKSSAEAALSHGFTACANSRYADFLEVMSAAQDQVSYYAEKYPACYFLPWTALNATMKALNLWCDLPKHYTGAIPPGQLPYLDIFSLDSKDAVEPVEMLKLINDGSLNEDMWQQFLAVVDGIPRHLSNPFQIEENWPLIRLHDFSKLPPAIMQAIKNAVNEFQNSWFVIAPPAAFNVSEDWRSRARRALAEATPKKEPPPNDPLVVRFVRHGCLVVSAWGDEAAELNAVVNSINI